MRFTTTAVLCGFLAALSACTATQNGVAVRGPTTSAGTGGPSAAALGSASGGIVGNSVTPGQCIKRDRDGRRMTVPC